MTDAKISPQIPGHLRKSLRVSLCAKGFCVLRAGLWEIPNGQIVQKRACCRRENDSAGERMTIMWLGISILVGLVFMLATPAWADFLAGLDAYKRGDYDTAMKEWRPLAEQGEAEAQWFLGSMYYQGKGVPQDDQEAVRWYWQAADQGDAYAQNTLGYMYEHGRGVPRNYVRAYMWASLAAAQGDEDAAQGLEKLEKKMTPDRIAEAQRLARKWKPKGK